MKIAPNRSPGVISRDMSKRSFCPTSHLKFWSTCPAVVQRSVFYTVVLVEKKTRQKGLQINNSPITYHSYIDASVELSNLRLFELKSLGKVNSK